MSAIFVKGYGAVSPAGWGAVPLREALLRDEPLSVTDLARPELNRALRVRPVPPPSNKSAFFAHPRLRRASPIAQYAVAAALEALGKDAEMSGTRRLGIIYCAMTGCVKYSQRFYQETLNDPMTASPLIFPETVFNAPASHLSALLAVGSINYTLVGDPGTFLQGLALAADWLQMGRVDGCVVVGAEELDWLVTEAFCLFERKAVVGEGAGAIYLTSEPSEARRAKLHRISDPQLFSTHQSRAEAAARARAELDQRRLNSLLCDSDCVALRHVEEKSVWKDWQDARISPKKICGEAFMAAAAWQCVAAVDRIAQGKCTAATVSIIGSNQQAIAAQFLESTVEN